MFSSNDFFEIAITYTNILILQHYILVEIQQCMDIKLPLPSENLKIISDTGIEKNKIDLIIEYGERKIKQITRRILEKEVKLESMESHSDYEYNDLLREYNEAEKEHKMDLKLFVELFDKYKVTIK